MRLLCIRNIFLIWCIAAITAVRESSSQNGSISTETTTLAENGSSESTVETAESSTKDSSSPQHGYTLQTTSLLETESWHEDGNITTETTTLAESSSQNGSISTETTTLAENGSSESTVETAESSTKDSSSPQHGYTLQTTSLLETESWREDGNITTETTTLAESWYQNGNITTETTTLAEEEGSESTVEALESSTKDSSSPQRILLGFSLMDDNNRWIKLVYPNSITLGLALELYGNTSTHIEISLVDVTPNKELMVLKTISYMPEEDLTSSNGSVYLDFLVQSEYFSEFGRYDVKLVARLMNSTLTDEIEIALSVLYDENIPNVDIICLPYMSVGTSENFTASVKHGGRVGLSWTWVIDALNINDTKNSESNITKNTQTFNISKAGEIILSVFVSNAVSIATNSCTLISLYPIKNFIFGSEHSLYNTTETVTFKVKTPATVQFPVGLVSINISGKFCPTTSAFISDGNVNDSTFSCNFTKQGQYVIYAQLTSKIASINLSTTVDIWDELTSLRMKPSRKYAKVKEKINITIENPPPSYFNYNISFGDGHTEVNSSNEYNLPFSPITYIKNYSSPGNYTVVFFAWNKNYSNLLKSNILVEHPVIDSALRLSPIEYNLPVPDGLVEFTLSYVKGPLPSNVICRVHYDDDLNSENEYTIFEKTSSMTFRHKFISSGFKTVTFNISNSVSSYILISKINAMDVSVSDIDLIFQNPSPMNKTRNATNPFMSIAVPTNVDFRIGLTNCFRLPYNMTETWKFGDQSTKEFNNRTDFKRSHTYKNRGTFELLVTFSFAGKTFSYKNNVSIGAMSVSCATTTADLRKSPFECTVEMDGTGTIYYEPDSGKVSIYEPRKTIFKDQRNITLETVYINYTKYGHYMPKFIGRNRELTEEVYLDVPLIFDFDLQNEIELHSSAETVPLPPGNITISIRLSENVGNRPLVNCSLITGDAVIRYIYNDRHNITTDSPIVFYHTYYDLGNQTISVTCENFVSRVTLLDFVEVINVCFGDEGIFDRQFSMQRKSMEVFELSDVYIGNRMSVICDSKDITFAWENCSSLELRKGVCLFNADADLKLGQYKIVLNVSIPSLGTYLLEPMFLIVFPSAPFAYISGGNVRKVYVNENIFFSAENLLERNNYNSTYTWHSSSGQFGKRAGKHISHEFKSIGIFNVTLAVTKHKRREEFTQIVHVLPRTSDITVSNIKCNINCMMITEVSTQTKFSVSGECPTCLNTNISLHYDWSLFEENVLVDLHNLTSTGIEGPAFSMRKNTLVPDKRYSIVLTAVEANGTSNSTLTMTFRTSKTGAGISGTCNTSFTSGKVAISANCTDWKSTDGKKTILRYLFETITRRRSAYGDVEDVVNCLNQGYEGSIFEMPIQVGDDEFNNSVTFRVRVYNKKGQYGVYEETLAYVPTPKQYLPSSCDDIVPVSRLYEEFHNTVGSIRRGGDVIRVFRYVGSIASMFKPYKQNMSVTTEKDILNGETSLRFHEDSVIVAKYKEITSNMINILSEEGRTCTTSNYKRFSLTDNHLIFSTIEAVVRNPSCLKLDVLEKLIPFVENMAECFTIRISQTPIPLPNDHIENIEDILKHIVRIFNVIVDVMLPQQLQDFNEELNEEKIVHELTTKKLRSTKQYELISRNLTEQELNEITSKSRLLMRLRSHERAIQHNQSKMAEHFYRRIQDTLMSVQTALLTTLVIGEKMEFHKRYLKLIVQKTTFREFDKDNANNTNLQHYFIGIQNINDTNHLNSIVDVKIIIYGKNPIIFGENASSLTSDVFAFNFGEDTVVDVKLENRGKPQPYLFSPLYSQSLKEKITHFYFDVMNDDDAILIYLKPHNFQIDDLSSWTLYTLYVSPTPFPTAATVKKEQMFNTSVRNWDREQGFKVFVPAHVCPKGVCYLGIKPVKVEKIASRKKRDVDPYSSMNHSIYNNTTFDISEANFTLQVITTACRAWNKDLNVWESDRCMVLPMTTIEETICRCTGHTFSSTFHVPPNMIVLYKVWGKFDPTNAAVYGTIAALLVVYIVLVVILRKEDSRDRERWAVSFLCDHTADDRYLYLMTVYTGLRRRAGTTSNIYFLLNGSEDDSDVRFLSNGEQKGFTAGSIATFVLGTKHSLGDLEYLRIWHDCSGPGHLQDWFLNKVEIDDLQTNERYVFLCDNWLSLHQEDGLIERVLPVSTTENLTAFKTLIAHQTQLNITEHHLWLSLLFRPRKSTFTRVQRLSCLLALLFLSMVSNAMYYKSAEDEAINDNVEIGIFRFSVSTMFVSLIGIIITTIPIVLLTSLFRHRRLRRVSSQCKNVPFQNEDEHEDTGFKIPVEYIEEDEKLLPHWVVYVAWMFLAITIAVSAFFLLLYSMDWGKTKSEQWLVSFVFSFFESILLVDPIKVLVVALLFATAFKTIIYEREVKVKIDQLKMFSAHFKKSEKHQFAAFVSNFLSGPEQLTQDEVERLKARRQEEKRAKKALTKLIVFAVYLFSIYSISFLERDTNSFYYKTSIDNYLYSSSNGQLGFSSINRTEDFIEWLRKTFLPTFYPETNYAGTELGVRDKQWFGDRASIRVGPARLRQLRTKEALCPMMKLTWPYPCVHEYSNKYADTTQHCEKWKPYHLVCARQSPDNSFTANSWKYTDGESIWGVPKTGEYGTYDGGGYIVLYTKTREQGQALINELVRTDWIDRNTRAVFLEFTLYNPYCNLFVYTLYLAEFIETGGILKWTETQAFRPIVSADMVGTFIILCYLIFIVYLLITTTKIFFKVKRNGCIAFAKQPWNWVNVLILFLGYACVAVYITRVTFSKKAMKLFYDNKLSQVDMFINFNHIVIWDNIFNSVFAIIVFLSTIQLLKILGYNKRFTQIISVIVNAGVDIGGFGFIFILIYITFAMLGTLLFGVQLKEYINFFTTCGTLANSFIGKNNVKSMITAVPTFSEFFYFSYMFCAIMALVTIFAAILNKSINEVKETLDVEYEKRGIKHYVSCLIKDIFGTVFRRNTDCRPVSKQDTFQAPLTDGADAYNYLRLLSRTFHNILKNEDKITKYQVDATYDDLYEIKENESTEDAKRKEILENCVFAPSHGETGRVHVSLL